MPKRLDYRYSIKECPNYDRAIATLFEITVMHNPIWKITGLIIAFIVSMPLAAQKVTTLTYQDFNASSIPSNDGWSFGAQEGGKVSISTDSSQNFALSGGALKGSYPSPSGGGMYVWGGFDVAKYNTSEVYIDFWAKMPGIKQGLKFVKVFGQGSNGNYANTTFGLDYYSGSMTQVSFGDGKSSGNDTQNVINLDGTYPDWIGRSYGTATVLTPQKKAWAASNWGNAWHHFKLHVKYNSGTTAANEVADGAFYVEIDGKVYVDAKNIFNRHYSNGKIQKVSFFDWSQSGTSPFEIWYDNVRITTGGFFSTAPLPPTDPSLKYD